LVPKIRVKLKSVELPEQIIFWRWVNVNILGVVTSNSVYHINISNDSKEVKVFDIVESMKNDQIIGYSLSPDEKWGALTGLFVTNEPVKVINGHIQLYWIDGGKQQLLEGHSCTFGRAYVHNETHKSNIFSFVEKKQSDKNSTMHIS
jgi:clathrin heavy chain